MWQITTCPWLASGHNRDRSGRPLPGGAEVARTRLRPSRSSEPGSGHGICVRKGGFQGSQQTNVFGPARTGCGCEVTCSPGSHWAGTRLHRVTLIIGNDCAGVARNSIRSRAFGNKEGSHVVNAIEMDSERVAPSPTVSRFVIRALHPRT